MTTPPRRSSSTVAAILILASALAAACSGTGGPPTSSTASEPPSSPPASANDLPTTDPGAGGGSSGNTGSGIVGSPPQVDPVDPGGGQARLLVPTPGQKDLRPVAPTKLEASVDGRHVLVKITWYSGVEPCNVLDSVKIERDGNDISVTPFEGTGDANAICIEIAELRATIVDLGELAPGTYRILAPTGDAAPLELTIS